jgi:glyoxylase-like metal-dependent hydrolase (beta-lactamase superfamily II)/rhodanese-related sulfurtransferase
MYFEHFYLGCLSHASYMIGSGGIATVIDPQRDVQIYLDEARKNSLKIEHVIETHLHADFVSGHRELAEKTGAKIYLGRQAGAKFPHVPVKDGDSVAFGRCRLQFLETPGHTVESVCILATDLDKSPEPFAVFTGDTLFIGDVGRPDLSPDKTPQELAGMLYDSLHDKLMKLPDAVEVYPAHGAGSLCGRQLSTDRSSTIGREKATNYAMKAETREEFIHLLTSELPERPGYFALDAEINREGAPALSELPPLTALSPAEVQAKVKQGATILDTRPADQFTAAHIPGSIFIGLTGQYASWAGTLLGLSQELVLVAEDPEHVEEARLRLARVGIERVAGYLADGLAGWTRAELPVVQTPTISPDELHKLLSEDGKDVQVLDVRRPPEWQGGHLDGAVLKPLSKLTASLADLDPERLTIVHCRSGYRSLIGVSLLERSGFQQVVNVTGGLDAWEALRLPVVSAQVS